MDAAALQAVATFAAVYSALHAGHWLGDFWMQTDHQAEGQARLGGPLGLRPARLLVRGHPAGRHRRARGPVRPASVTAVAGRRHDRQPGLPLRRRPARPALWIAERLGQTGFYQMAQVRPGTDDRPHLGTGAHALDQSWHKGFIFISAALIAL